MTISTLNGNWQAEKGKSRMQNRDWKIVLISVIAFSCLIFLPLVNAQAPKKVKDGIEFSYNDPKAKSVHLAGSFNNWAENQEGKVNRPEFLMTKGKDGVWRKTVKIGGGKHSYKFVVNGTEWVADPHVKTADKSGNSTIAVSGAPIETAKAVAASVPTPAAATAPSVAAVPGGGTSPKKVAGGYEFSLKAPTAKAVYLAGDFNNWAEHKDGIISRPEFLMTKGSDGIWRKTVALSPGQHMYKFNVDNILPWSPDPNNSTPRDKDDNSLINATGTNAVGGETQSMAGAAGGPKKVAGGYEFSFKAPQAKSVHLAGDFNEWGNNDNGMVTQSAHLMTKGADGVWRKTVSLTPGKHAYKFVMDGNNWSPDPNNSAPRDKDDNSIFNAE